MLAAGHVERGRWSGEGHGRAETVFDRGSVRDIPLRLGNRKHRSTEVGRQHVTGWAHSSRGQPRYGARPGGYVQQTLSRDYRQGVEEVLPPRGEHGPHKGVVVGLHPFGRCCRERCTPLVPLAFAACRHAMLTSVPERNHPHPT